MVSKFSSQLKPKFRSLVLDNEGTTFEELIYGGFRVNILDIISIKAQLSKAFHIQPSEIDKMPFWELELYIKELEKLVRDENEQNKKEMDNAGVNDMKRMMKPGGMNSMMKGMTPKMPSMPNMGSFKMPTTVNMPSFK